MRLIKFREIKTYEKDQAIDKMMLKKKNIEKKLKKLEKQLKKRVVGNDDLKFIDFHQLQIENKNFLKELEQKNIKLQDLKILVG